VVWKHGPAINAKKYLSIISMHFIKSLLVNQRKINFCRPKNLFIPIEGPVTWGNTGDGHSMNAGGRDEIQQDKSQ
jgi:hypothetical protein